MRIKCDAFWLLSSGELGKDPYFRRRNGHGMALAGKSSRAVPWTRRIMQWWTEQQLRSGYPRRRRQALEKAASRPGPQLEIWATAALDDRDSDVRLVAVKALLRLPQERAAVCLGKATWHQDPAVREAAVRLLPSLPAALVVPALCQALRDSQDSVRFAAARSLEILNWQPSSDEEMAALAVARHDFRSAVQCGSAAIEFLLSALADPTYPNRRGVVLALTDLGDARITKALLAATRDPDPGIRTVVLERLGERGEPDAFDCIRAALRDSNRNVRAAAAEGLGKLGDTGAVEALHTACRDNHWEVRKASLEALGRLKDRRSLTALAGALNDADHDVRLAAVEALGQMACPESIAPLIGACIDAHATVRRAAENALDRIDPDWEHTLVAQEAMPRLKAALSSNEYSVRQAAAGALGRIGAEESIRERPTALAHAASHHRRAAVDVFLEFLEDSDCHLRLAAVDALARLQDPAAAGPLQARADDLAEDGWVRSAAKEGLSRLAGSRAMPRLGVAIEGAADKIVPLVLWSKETESGLKSLPSN